MMRGVGLRRYELNERLQRELVKLSDQEQRPAEDIQDELLAVGLYHLKSSNKLIDQWETLTRREKEVTALICRGYTNKQMAERMGLSPNFLS
jgi:DNA-binding NarL/FixJ family response regulator